MLLLGMVCLLQKYQVCLSSSGEMYYLFKAYIVDGWIQYFINYFFVLISCDGIFLQIYIGYIHVAVYPYGVLGVFIADIDNGVSKSMSIRIIIICWSVFWDDNVFLLHSILVPTISQSSSDSLSFNLSAYIFLIADMIYVASVRMKSCSHFRGQFESLSMSFLCVFDSHNINMVVKYIIAYALED